MEILFSAVILVAFFLISQVNFLLFHTLIEVFCIGTMLAIFFLVWNMRKTIENRSVLVLGIAFFFIAWVDALHIMSYKGMGVFPGNDPNLPTQFWIVGRYLQSSAFFVAPLLLNRQVKSSLILLVFTGVTTLLVAAVFGGIFPDCFIQGTGLTAFKIYSEYIIILLLAAAMWQFSNRRKQFEPEILKFILFSLGASILSELFFTLYSSVYELSNIMGHVFKIIAILFLYKALIWGAIKDPFNLIFRELKTREQKLKVSEERFSRMFHEHSAIMLLIQPETGEIIKANSAAARFYGHTQDQLCQMTIQQINTLPAEEIAFLRSQAHDKKKNHFIFPHRLASGEIREVEVHSSLIISQGQKILFSIIHDITERKKAEEELSGQKKLFETMFNTIPDAVVITNTNREMQLANKGMENIFGYTVDELMGKTTEIIYAQKDIFHQTGKIVFEEKSQKKGDRFITYFKNKNGLEFPCETFGAKLFDDKNQWLGNLGIMRDISEQIKQEEEGEILQKQLSQAQKMQAIGTLAGGIAHDFNNILAAILGYAGMAKNNCQPESIVAKDLDGVLEAGNRAKNLVRQILAFSRQDDTGRIVLQPASIVQETLTMLRSSLPTTIEIIHDLDPGTGLVFVDPTQLNQILLNLCTNAFHAMEESGGKLDISLKEVTLSNEDLAHEPGVNEGTFIQLSIGDSGTGIEPSVRDKIFDPYFTTKEAGKGTGMGLSIVHGIVKNYGGFISLDSELGKGTIFHVFLPAVKKGVLTENETPGQIPRGKERVLFVDDEEMLAEMGQTMLERLGYNVTVRNSSLEALKTFRSQPDQFDLIITDQTMPRMTGSELSIQMLQIRPDIPIILCTGFSTLISEEKAKSMGIKEFALKPLAVKDLANLIRKVLGES